MTANRINRFLSGMGFERRIYRIGGGAGAFYSIHCGQKWDGGEFNVAYWSPSAK